MEGWIKIHRKLLESSVFAHAEYTHVWVWCLLKATHKPQKFPFNGKDIEIKEGEFITGRGKACKELHISQQSFRTVIDYLKSTNRITIRSTNRFSIISIVNWKQYQAESNQENNQPANQQLTSQQPATNHIQEGKEQKNVKKEYKGTKKVFSKCTTCYGLNGKHGAFCEVLRASVPK